MKTKEKVIFRHTFDPYAEIWKYMCIFPEDEANRGNVCCVNIWKDKYGKWLHDCYYEADRYYVLEQKIIHKNDPIVPELVAALKGFYDGEYKVCERMVIK